MVMIISGTDSFYQNKQTNKQTKLQEAWTSQFLSCSFLLSLIFCNCPILQIFPISSTFPSCGWPALYSWIPIFFSFSRGPSLFFPIPFSPGFLPPFALSSHPFFLYLFVNYWIPPPLYRVLIPICTGFLLPFLISFCLPFLLGSCPLFSWVLPTFVLGSYSRVPTPFCPSYPVPMLLPPFLLGSHHLHVFSSPFLSWVYIIFLLGTLFLFPFPLFSWVPCSYSTSPLPLGFPWAPCSYSSSPFSPELPPSFGLGILFLFSFPLFFWFHTIFCPGHPVYFSPFPEYPVPILLPSFVLGSLHLFSWVPFSYSPSPFSPGLPPSFVLGTLFLFSFPLSPGFPPSFFPGYAVPIFLPSFLLGSHHLLFWVPCSYSPSPFSPGLPPSFFCWVPCSYSSSLFSPGFPPSFVLGTLFLFSFPLFSWAGFFKAGLS